MSPAGTVGTTDPASRGSSKAKALGELSKYEKNEQRVSRHYSVRKKIVDGKAKLVWQLDNSYYGVGPGEKPELPREYTKFADFKAALCAELETIRKGLGDDTA